MRFRPCIDVHNGRVKQIIGGSLADKSNTAAENFVSEYGADFYAELYKSRRLPGGHIILLNPAESEYYAADKEQAFAALKKFPGGLQIGGGMNPENAWEFLNAGASHIIVTSYVFSGGKADIERLKEISAAAGRERLVIDLSCRRRGGEYYITTDRWQKFTDVRLDASTLDMFAEFCSEFLVHAVDVEGRAKGIEKPLAELLGSWDGIPVTYAGGIGSFTDLDVLKATGQGKLDFTVGSALDIFGGTLDFEKVCNY